MNLLRDDDKEMKEEKKSLESKKEDGIWSSLSMTEERDGLCKGNERQEKKKRDWRWRRLDGAEC